MRYLQVLVLSAAALGAAPATAPRIVFEDITGRTGVHFVANSSPTPDKHQPESMVAGVALFDYDGDGFLDIFFVNGGTMPGLTKDGAQFSNRLYHNNGNLTFTDVTEKAGVAGEGYGMGVAIGDYDNDGRPDIYLASLTRNQLFHNNGDGTFTDVTAKAGVSGGLQNGRKMWSVSAVWFDYDNDGRLDLFVSNYCQWDAQSDPPCEVGGRRVYCNPRYYKALPHTLYHNNGDGTFTDVSTAVGLDKYPGRGMGAVVADYDGDGFMDVFVANDDAPNQLFHNIGGKRFEEVAADAGVAYAEAGNVISGMGADFRDVFNRGLPDIWVTAMEKETFPLFLNHGKGVFTDKTGMAGLSFETEQMSGWANGIVDFDNDGWKDLFAARSNVIDNVEMFAPRRFPEPNAVFRNLGNGRFENVSATAGESFRLPPSIAAPRSAISITMAASTWSFQS